VSNYLQEIVVAAGERKLDVTRVHGNATQLTLCAKPSGLVEVLVCDNILEWFITLKDERTGDELFSERCEHYATEGESRAELEVQMRDTVITVVDAIRASDLRIGTVDGCETLELHDADGDRWFEIWELFGE